MAAVVMREYALRPMRRADVEAVHGIERISYPFPWSRGIFSDCLRIGYCCRIAELGREVCAYSILSAAAGEAHLLNLCVAPAHRRSGLGALMLQGVTVDATLLGARRLFLEVRPSNAPAMALYHAAGFRTIGRRPGYYPADAGREDALVMVRHLPGDDDD